MNADKKNGFRKITPVTLETNSSNKSSNIKNSSNTDNLKTIGIGLGLFFLSVGVITVIFFLPAWVENNQTSTTDKSITNTNNNDLQSNREITTKNTNDISPWEKTQNSQARKDAQFVLQEILDTQKQLEENNVTQWAEKDYNNALGKAKQGDTLYNRQQYTFAKEHYDSALKDLKSLIEKIDILYKLNLQRGHAALEGVDQETAIKSFETALLFKEQTGEAERGLKRAKILDQVYAEINAGDEAVNHGNYNDANAFYQAALKLDPETTLAKNKLAENNRRINDIQFKRYMSNGFKALEKNNFQTAKTEFNNALKLKPNSSEAASAIQQTNVQSTNKNINIALTNAADAEAKEDWRTAIDYYQSALKIDPNLSASIIGLKNAKAQLATYNKISNILANPERLSDKNVLNEVQKFYHTLKQLKSPGPILNKQIQELENQLAVSATPVNIRLVSDNQTDVTVYKVGKMGVFDSKEISLRPGKYTAVGIRPGYKDVRVEFLVSAEKNNTINIRTEEKIN